MPLQHTISHAVRHCLLFVLLAGTFIRASAFQVDRSSVVDRLPGIWEGTLNAGGATLRVVFHITLQADGSLAATMDSPDQGAKDLPVDSVVALGSQLRLVVKVASAWYGGVIAPDVMAIDGNWNQGGKAYPLALARTEKITEIKRPQTPEKPYPYNEEEVLVENKSAKVTLAGTLTTPKFGGPNPAVVLITGSGPQDRDETILGHQPFLVLADYLTRQGIAVLRLDDRGFGKSTGTFSSATTKDFASDALAAVNFLKRRSEIDHKRIGLIGHSEGGIIAPMVAVKSKDVAFIVLMAGTGLPGEQVLYQQGELIGMADSGRSKESVDRNRWLQEHLFAIVKKQKDTSKAKAELRAFLGETLNKMTDEEKKSIGSADAFIDRQIAGVNSPWMRFFLTYDPAVALRKVKCPVLAMNGAKDLQVAPKQNLAAIEAALKAGGNTRATIRELPGLNHLFQDAKTGSPDEYQKIDETISPAALQLIAEWILENAK